MLILKTLARNGELHGFEIANSIQLMSEEVLQVEEGSLYPALQRMLIKGWLVGEWGKTAENRRARYYRVTLAGKKRLQQKSNNTSVLPKQLTVFLNPHEEQMMILNRLWRRICF